MQNIDLSFAQDPNTLALALIYGLVPAIAWLFFWVREHKARPKASGSLFYSFLVGALMVVLALPVEKILATFATDSSVLTVLWASAEEVLKFGGFLIMLFAGSAIESPVDYAFYAVVVALGFAGFENALYFLEPLQSGNTVVLMLASAMRFLGTTLMHAAAASIPGIALGLAFYKPRRIKQIAAVVGLLCAAIAHSIFNLSIVKNNGMDFFTVFSILWLVTIVILVLFERLRRMESDDFAAGKRENAVAGLAAAFETYLLKVTVSPVEMRPLVEVLSEKGIVSGTPDHAEFLKLIATIRMAYSAYLSSEGASAADTEKVIMTVIPDSISPKAATDILTVLLHAVEGEVATKPTIQI